MTCRFLERLSLRSLIAPFAEDEFRARYWEQQPLVVHRGDRDYYGDLFTLQDFDGALARSPNYVKLANAAVGAKSTTQSGGSVSGLEAVLSDMRDGSTLVLDQLHQHDPKLGLLCRIMAEETGHRFQTNLYLTPPHGKGFTPHWDNHDVFILQVLGSKHWQIEKQRRLFPSGEQKMGDDGRELQGERLSFTLEQGDLIYIPRGFVHAAECGDEPSLHITFGVTAYCLEHLLSAALRAAVLQDQRLRAALPLGFMRGDGRGLVDRATAALLEVADERFLGGVIDLYRDELVRTYQLDVSGQISEFFDPRPLTVDDIVGPRRGIMYRLHLTPETVRLNFGARSIVFRDIFRNALEFGMSKRSFAIRDLPGDLQDDDRIAFIERLMEEGLVVRKP